MRNQCGYDHQSVPKFKLNEAYIFLRLSPKILGVEVDLVIISTKKMKDEKINQQKILNVCLENIF